MGNKSSRAVSATEKALQHALTRATALSPDMFALTQIAHHGVPSNAKTLALCGLQGLLAVGTASGHVKLYGRDNLEVLLEAPRPISSSVGGTTTTTGVVFLRFTAHQRLVATYTDSSIRIFDLSALPNAPPCAQVSETWTTCSITSVETITYQAFPFVFVALDDGSVHVLHEETGKMSTYTITPRDVGITTTEEDKHLQYVTAMATNPRDANQLLLAFEATSTVFLWDFAKHKVIKEFSLAAVKTTKHAASFGSDTDGSSSNEPNAVLSLSWHASGKRFVAGFKHGGFGVFRVDKEKGLYHVVPRIGTSVHDAATAPTPIKQIQWICAPPTSRHSHLPGAIIFTGGRPATETHVVTLVCPPRGMSDDDAITSLVKSEQLVWQTTTIDSPGACAEVCAFAVASDQVDHCARAAPLSVVLLAGNPMDGCQPAVHVQCLPCYVQLREDDREEWEWMPERMPQIASISHPLLQQSSLRGLFVVNHMNGSEARTLIEDLRQATDWNQVDAAHTITSQDEFEWPINGGRIAESLLKSFASGDQQSRPQQTATLLLTAHTNGLILFWEVVSPADRMSRGVLRLLHVLDVGSALQALSSSPTEVAENPSAETETATVNSEPSALAFCSQSRSLIVGFSAGEVIVFDFGDRATIEARRVASGSGAHIEKDQDSSDVPKEEEAITTEAMRFHVVFSLHIHSSEIKRISFSSSYQFAAVADDAGVVSLVNLANGGYELLIFDISVEEPASVESMHFNELVQVTEIPMPPAAGTGQSLQASPNAVKSPPRSPFDRKSITSPTSRDSQSLIVTHREIVPVLFVGRGNGKLELYHVQTAKKIGESLVDPSKLSAVTSITMVDALGQPMHIAGRPWVSPRGDLTAATTTEEVSELDERTRSMVKIGSEEVHLAKQALHEALIEECGVKPKDAASSENDGVVVDDVELALQDCRESTLSWTPVNAVEAHVPAGSLGLRLHTEIKEHAVVAGFVPDNTTASKLEKDGVQIGHVITYINGVSVASHNRDVVCNMLVRLRQQEKLIVFATGFSSPLLSAAIESPAVQQQNSVAPPECDENKPRFLVCSCGRSLHVVQAMMPKAADIASGPKELPVQPLASVELQAPVVSTAIIRVPVHDRVEHALVALDQSNRLYIVSLLTLQLLWSADCPNVGSRLDGVQAGVAYDGELIIANAFGEIERLSLLSEAPARESAMLQLHSVSMRLWLEERKLALDKEHAPSPKKKGGIAALKKLVTGVVKEASDLNKVFHFSVEDAQRRQLMGNRKSVAQKSGEHDEQDSSKQVAEGLAGTKVRIGSGDNETARTW
ncbi:hypothetical protein PINS_up009387 [Pythium insidiosum]|nr:hypothetical protein PINS_up009387 [Pythium insidiosum]